MKCIISMIGAMMLTAMPAFANIAEGTSGDCNWVIDNDGNFNVSSENDNAVLGTWEGDSAPWSNYKEAITTVAFSTPVNAQTCTNMFNGCSNLKAVYLDNFYTNDVTDMSYMFANCASLEVVEFGMTVSPLDEDACFSKGVFTAYRDNFLTSNVTSMASMFEGCKSLQSFNITNLDVHSVMDFSGMFADCIALESMDMTNLTVHKNANVENMFSNCKNLMSITNQSVFPSELEDATFMSLPTRGVCSVDLPMDCFDDYATAKGWKYLFIANEDGDSKNMSLQVTTGISNMAVVDDAKAAVFTFGGERVSAPVKGLNIIDGKKVMVK